MDRGDSAASPVARDRARRGSTATAGQTLTEFALLLPVVLLLILAVIDFGRVAVDYNALAHAAREGAQYAGSIAQPTCDYPSGQNPPCPATILSKALASAPQVPQRDVMSLSVRNKTVSDTSLIVPDRIGSQTGQLHPTYEEWVISITFVFHPITTAVLGGAYVTITTNARYIEGEQ